ncbi:MAG: hypothetical protein K0Q64_272 [Nitrobacter vulgaris]|nr:hypothetical protein [Nitrobacter vulgaris]
MRGIAFHGFDKVRDQVVTLLELHIDVGEGLADALAECDQSVIGDKRKHSDGDDDAENNQAGRHEKSS